MVMLTLIVPVVWAVREVTVLAKAVVSEVRVFVVAPLASDVTATEVAGLALLRVTDLRSVSAVTALVANAVSGETSRESRTSAAALIAVLAVLNGVADNSEPVVQSWAVAPTLPVVQV